MQKDLIGTIAKFAALGVAVAAVSKAITGSIDASRRFESSFTGIRKTVEGTEAQFRALAAGMKELSTQIPINVNELNRIGEAAGQLGIATGDILEFTETMAKLGVTTNLSANEAATALARFAKITGLSSDKFENLGSAIVELGNNLATTEGEIVTLSLRMAGVGVVVGLTEPQILGLAGALSSLGIEAEAGGTAISRVLVEMQKAVELGGEKLENFGRIAGVTGEQFAKVFGEDAAKGFKLFIKGLGDVRISGMTTLQGISLLGFENVRTLRTLTTLTKGYDELVDALVIADRGFREATALTKEAELRFATLDSQVIITKNKLELLRIEIGDKLAPAFTKMVTFTGDLAEAVREGNDPLGKFFTTLKKFADDPTIVQFWKDLADEMERIPIIGKNIEKLSFSNIISFGGLISGVTGGFLAFNAALEGTRQGLVKLGALTGKTTKPVQILSAGTLQLGTAMTSLDGAIVELIPAVEFIAAVWEKEEEVIGGVTGALTDTEKALEALEQVQEQFTKSIEDQIAAAQKQIDTFGFTNAQLIEYETIQLLGEAATLGLTEAMESEIEKIRELRLALDDLEQAKLFDEEQAQALEDFLEAQQQAIEDSLLGIQIFAADVANSINDAFANTLTELAFDFENFGNAVKNVLKSIANAFFKLLATFITNPLRIGLETSLSGGGGGGANAIGGLLGGAGGLGGLGASFGALGGLFGIGGGLTTISLVPIGAGFFAPLTEAAGLFASLGAALPAIGLVIAALAIAIPLILNLLKKSPKIDIDIGVMKEKIDGEIVKRGANVQEFLDALDAPNSDLAKEIVRFSTVQGGVGVKGKVRENIRLAILTVIGGSIAAIQSILSQLPEDLFKELNIALLAAEVNIEDFKGKDKLLEFDKKGKNVVDKLMAFIAGTLPARFFASLRESFFVPMLETLGVASEGAQELMDDFVESLKGASPEEAKRLGEEFLATIDAYVDVFNLLNEGMKGVIGQALSDVRALAASLDIESATGIPTLREIEAALRDLFETGQLTGETARQFMALRQAVIQLTVGLAQSISNITAIIAQLDSDIVGLGGSAIGTTAGIEEAIGALQNLLDNEALSLDEREAILGELNSLVDQLAASAIATVRLQIQSNTNAVNSQIRNLQLLKTVEADKHQAALNALNKELGLVEALESLIEGIRGNISSLLLAPGGPKSVGERISRARGSVADLFAQLASASPEDQIGIASQLQDLLNELNQLRQEAFQAPSAESDDLFREIIGNLEKLEGLLEPARSSEEIQASIETIGAASQVLLSSIDSQIASFQSQLTGLQSTGNQLTGAVADRVRELKEAIRAEFILILEERLLQLEEITATGFEVEIDALNSIDKSGVESVQIEGEMLIVLRNIESAISGGGGTAFGFDIPGFAHGGFVPPGVDMVAMLHGGSQGEDIIPRNGNSPQGGNVYLTLPPMTFSANQVVNPKMFMSELMKSLHDRRVTDEIAKVVGGKK